MLLEFKSLYPSKNFSLGDCTEVTHQVDTGDHHPVKRVLQRTSYAQKMQINEPVQDMLQKGVIRKSTSPWSFLVVLVKSKDKTEKPRFCVDFRELNKLNSKSMWPLARVEDAANSFENFVYFSLLNLNSRFRQIRMAKKDISKCSFVLMDGQYEFLRMPFGLSGGTATF